MGSQLSYILVTHKSAELSLLASSLSHPFPQSVSLVKHRFSLAGQVCVKSKGTNLPPISWTLLLGCHLQPCNHSHQTAMLCLLELTKPQATRCCVLGSGLVWFLYDQELCEWFNWKTCFYQVGHFYPSGHKLPLAMKYCASIHSVQLRALILVRKVSFSWLPCAPSVVSRDRSPQHELSHLKTATWKRFSGLCVCFSLLAIKGAEGDWSDIRHLAGVVR